jgi:hypothetical protein
MSQLTQAFPDRSFSGIGGISTFEHALNYFLLGCGTVQVCTAAMLDTRSARTSSGSSTRGWRVFSRRTPTRAGPRSPTPSAFAATVSSRSRRSAGPARRTTGGYEAEGYAEEVGIKK